MRYEFWTQPVERHDQQANYLINEGKLIFPNNKIPSGCTGIARGQRSARVSAVAR